MLPFGTVLNQVLQFIIMFNSDRMMAVPATVIYFTSYDQLKSRMQKKFGNYYLIPAVAGGAARSKFMTK